MSKLSALRKRVGYDADVPRCNNCKQFRRGGEWLRDSLPRTSPPTCKVHGFTIKLMAVCDKWAGTNGDTLVKGE